MSSSVRVEFHRDVSREWWDYFCRRNGVERGPDTTVHRRHASGVELRFTGSGVVVSASHNLSAVADAAKAVLREFGGTWRADPELKPYLADVRRRGHNPNTDN